MKLIIVLSCLVAVTVCGVIHHEDQHGHKATSYQNIHIEHFHAVPTYVKKEDQHLLHHPVSVGNTKANVEVQHGGKHDHGYAVASYHTDLQSKHGDEATGHEFAAGVGGGEEIHFQGPAQTYQGHEADEQASEPQQGHYEVGEDTQQYEQEHQEEEGQYHQ